MQAGSIQLATGLPNGRDRCDRARHSNSNPHASTARFRPLKNHKFISRLHLFKPAVAELLVSIRLHLLTGALTLFP